jgi:hypothetical protein
MLLYKQERGDTMAERLVTISLREYEALRDLSDQFDIIRETSEYEKVFNPIEGNYTRVINVSQENLNKLFANLLNVDKVVEKIDR